MAYVLAALAGLAFGAADQYLGSFSALGGWTAAVSGLSAPWLLLPFVAGVTQRETRRAILLGLVVTLAALVGYIAMTYSPLENVPVDRFLPGVVAMTTSGYNPLWIAGGLLTGPLFGYLGNRWRVERSWMSAVLVTVALTMEPVVRSAAGMLSSDPVVWGLEVATGVVVAGVFVASMLVARRSGRPARTT